MEGCGTNASALPLSPLWLHPTLLWGYTVYCTLFGLNQSKLACIQVLEDQESIQGVGVVKRDAHNTQRCYIEHLWLDEHCGSLTENGLFFISYLFSTAQACGIPQMLAYIPHQDVTAIHLLKQSGFHQAMTREHYLLESTAEALTNAKRSTLLQAGWKRVSHYYTALITDHYNSQLPSLWRHTLERCSAHFSNETQHHGRLVERWWLAHPEKETHCQLLLELVHPSSLSPWQISLFPSPDQANIDFTLHLHHIQAYCQAIAGQYLVTLCVWGYQTHLKNQAAATYKHLLDKDVSLFIKDSKIKLNSGLHAKLPKGILGLESSTTGGGHTSPA
jgi:hypothetical protein